MAVETFEQFGQRLTHVMPVSIATETQMGPGVAVYYNPEETPAPDYATVALGRIAAKHLDSQKSGGRKSGGRVYEPGVGTGTFLVSTMMHAALATPFGLSGDDSNRFAVATTQYNLAEASKRRGSHHLIEIRNASWDLSFPDPRDVSSNYERPQYDVIYFNPLTLPAKMYSKHVPALYASLTPKGLGIIRLPGEEQGVDWNDERFDTFIDPIRQKGYHEYGLRSVKGWVDVPEDTPSPWDERRKCIEYRTAAVLLVGRMLSPALSDPATAPRSSAGLTLYQDIQARLRVTPDDSEYCLV